VTTEAPQAITWPLAAPAPQRTCHNAPMSAPYARFMQWINANGVVLGTWATDQCVESQIAKLERLAAWIAAPTLPRPAGACSDTELAAVRDQLRRVMARRPAQRVLGTQQRRA
jgi:hypothetical protein